MRPKTGFPGIFSEDLEADFALFLKHCQFLRIPRTKNRFKEDINHSVEYNNLTFLKLMEEGPGECQYFGCVKYFFKYCTAKISM